MKQTAGVYAEDIRLNIVSDISIFAQAVWRMCARHVEDRLGRVSKRKAKKRAQARRVVRTEQTVPGAMMQSIPILTDVRHIQPIAAGRDKAAIRQVGTLTEIRSIESGVKQQAGQTQHLKQTLNDILPALASYCQQRWLVLMAPPCLPTAAEFSAAGIDPSRVLVVHTSKAVSSVVLERALQSGTCGAVLAWLAESDVETLDHLRKAAEQGQAWGVLFRSLAQTRQPEYRRTDEQTGANADVQLEMAVG